MILAFVPGRGQNAPTRMLTCIELHDFKSFSHQRVDLAPLTLFVGPNASGKSNLFDALHVLRGLSLGLTAEEVFRPVTRGGALIWPGIRGGSGEAARAGTERFAIASAWRDDLEERHYGVEMETARRIALLQETFGARDTNQIFRIEDRQETIPSAIGSAQQPIASTIGPIQRGIQAIIPMEISPSLMRDYAQRGATTIGSRAENISAVVYQYCADSSRKADLVDWISQLCAPEIVDIDFTVTDIADVMLKLVERSGARISARSLSDGTLRFLGVIMALLSAKPGAIVLLEEPDVGLHPARIHLLAELLESVAHGRSVQILATTHSPLLLSNLTSQTLGQSVAFARDFDSSTTIVRRLCDMPNFAEIEARRGIEYLFTTEWLERAA